MRRREFITLLGSAAAAWPLAARAQQPEKRYTIGILSAGSAPVLRKVLFDALRELGWIEGKNIVFERRYAENRVERLPDRWLLYTQNGEPLDALAACEGGRGDALVRPLSGGRIEVVNALAGGAEFLITLPTLPRAPS